MVSLTVEEAASRLSQMVDAAREDEEIVLTRNDLPIAKMVLVPLAHPHPKRGSAKGMNIYIAEDFDAPLDEFKEYME